MRMSRTRSTIVPLFLIGFLAYQPLSHAYEIYDAGAFLSSPTLGPSSLGYLDGVYDEFDGSGIELTFVNNLDSNGIGQLTWGFANNTSGTLSDVNLFGYIDGEIDVDLTGSLFEYGEYVSVDGVGNLDIFPDTWEIDDAGFIFGDIYDNLLLGTLDETNAVPVAGISDVSVALGFELGDLLAGDTWLMTLDISEENIGGLFHGDSLSDGSVYINGTVVVNHAVSVDEASGLLLFLMGLSSLLLVQRKKLIG